MYAWVLHFDLVNPYIAGKELMCLLQEENGKELKPTIRLRRRTQRLAWHWKKRRVSFLGLEEKTSTLSG